MKPALSHMAVMKDPSRCATTTAAKTLFLAIIVFTSPHPARAQETVSEKIDKLDAQMTQVQAQLEQSARELKDIQQQLSALRGQAEIPGKETIEGPSIAPAAQLAAAVEELREKQDVQESQLAIQEQAKVGSESKYPVTVSGMILMNSFVNTRAVDTVPTPAVALSGAGATGITLRQSVVGIDASGPHLFGAHSHADLRIDFDGSQSATYSTAIGSVRLRTAHAELDWLHAKAFFSFDRPILSPDSPTSLTAVAQPALAWSGNLWAWNPQAGVSESFPVHRALALQMQTAVIDVEDPYNQFTSSAASPYTPPSTGEQSRWPGVEGRLSLLGPLADSEAHLGVGGFFAPHRTSGGTTYNSWAGTMDFGVPISSHLQMIGSAYRGQALGGLGEGADKDVVYRIYGNEAYFRTLDDMGGWVQAKQKINERLEFNEAFGMDNVPAYQLVPFAIAGPDNYYNFARNRTFTSNVIYKPSAYLLYSIEYRRIASSFVDSPTTSSDVIGVAAGYRF